MYNYVKNVYVTLEEASTIYGIELDELKEIVKKKKIPLVTGVYHEWDNNTEFVNLEDLETIFSKGGKDVR